MVVKDCILLEIIVLFVSQQLLVSSSVIFPHARSTSDARGEFKTYATSKKLQEIKNIKETSLYVSKDLLNNSSRHDVVSELRA